ncbi:MAG: hypothetical protein KGQ26_06360 [Rhodospirillales bacterium]|nr:hypothetical protein [Rhodospirillales bacterium]MDE2319439.1 hypothetical protein [Rhodospirillales bacterium]
MRHIWLASAALILSAGAACAQSAAPVGSGGMPENAGPRAYLHMAQHAIEHQDKARADSALSHAETRLLTRSVDAGSAMSTDQSPAVKAIEDARNALSSGDYTTASQDTANALQEVEPGSSMSDESGMSSGNANAMSNDGDNDTETGSMAPSVNATSRAGDMSQGGGVTHDAPTPSGGMQNTPGMSHDAATGMSSSPAQ